MVTPRNDATAAGRGNRRTLIALAVLFGLPYLASFTFFYHPEWLPGRTLNHGDLVTPVRPVAALLDSLRTDSGAAVDLLGHWSLLSFGAGTCDKVCSHNLYKMRQVRRALGVDRQRVVRYYVVPGDWDRAQYEQVLPEYRGTRVLIRGASAGASVLSPFRIDDRQPRDQIYIIDPNGNLMMRYTPDADPKGMLKDLQQLLKASQIG